MRYTTATILFVLFFAVFACSESKPSVQWNEHSMMQFKPARELQLKTVKTEAVIDSLLNNI